MALAVGLLNAAPAVAAYTASISFPGGNTEFYSPFAGPASIQFDFDAGDPSRVFRVRVRPVGSPAFKVQYFTIDPANLARPSPQTRNVSWDGLVTGSDRPYEVVVNPVGQQNIAQAFFVVRPRLVSIVSASPSPFFPWIDDGYKDTLHTRFTLVEGAAVEARVYRPRRTGRCCGALVRNEDLGSLTVGTNDWIWDGRDDNGDNLAKGNYFVRIRADDGVVAPLSRARKVAIARTYRATKTKSKAASRYHHVGPITPLVLGGSCLVSRSANGVLQVLCQGGRMSVYWRWGLSSVERIERASFVRTTADGCPRSILRTGHTRHESSFTMHENLDGALGNCYLVTARITYSYPKAS